MNRNTIEKIILLVPYFCFAILVLSLILVKNDAIQNIGLLGAIAGIPIGIIGRKKTCYKKLATGDIILGSVVLAGLLGLIGFLMYIGRIIGNSSIIG